MAYYLRQDKKKKGTYLQMYESYRDKEKNIGYFLISSNPVWILFLINSRKQILKPVKKKRLKISLSLPS